jgi:hypothetical protein
MNKLYLLLLIFFSIVLDNYAQVEKENRISLASGVIDHRVKDQTVSPMIYRGKAMPLHLSWSYCKLKYRHEINLSFNKLQLESSISNTDKDNVHIADNFNLLLRYSFIRKLNTSNTSFHFLGASLESYTSYRDLLMNRHGNGMTQTMDHMNSFSIKYQLNILELPFGLDRLNFDIAFPVFSYILFGETYNLNVSDAYKNVDMNENIIGQIYKNGEFATFNTYSGVESKFSLVKQLTSRLSTSFTYRFHYYIFDKYKELYKVKSLNNSFLLGITYNFQSNE